MKPLLFKSTCRLGAARGGTFVFDFATVIVKISYVIGVSSSVALFTKATDPNNKSGWRRLLTLGEDEASNLATARNILRVYINDDWERFRDPDRFPWIEVTEKQAST
jgi:hypothetical protein